MSYVVLLLMVGGKSNELCRALEPCAFIIESLVCVPCVLDFRIPAHFLFLSPEVVGKKNHNLKSA